MSPKGENFVGSVSIPSAVNSACIFSLSPLARKIICASFRKASFSSSGINFSNHFGQGRLRNSDQTPD